MSIESAINSILSTDTGVQATVDSYVRLSVQKYMIFGGNDLPDNVLIGDILGVNAETEDLTYETKTINHYQTTPTSGASEGVQIEVTADCRAETRVDAKNIMSAAFTALNRQRDDSNCYFFVCAKNEPIPPKEAGDNWNAVLSITAHGLLNNE